MAATKRGKTGTKAATSATKTKTAPSRGATRNTKAASNGTDPGAPRTRAAATKKAAPIKLTDKQRDLLGSVHAKGATGHLPANKNEERSLEALATKKLLKRGKKDKEKGSYAYLLTKAGEKHLAGSTAG